MDIITLALAKKYTNTSLEKGMDWEKIHETPDTLEGYGITDGATKSEINAIVDKLVNIYHYRGSLINASYLSRISNPEIGDVYNLLDTGMNVAWSGSVWDELGAAIAQPITSQEIERIVIIREPPTYVAPTATLTLNPTTNIFEDGLSQNYTVTLTYTKNDGGDPSSAEISYIDADGQITTQSSSTSAPIYNFNFTGISKKGKFVSEINYQEGPIKKDNVGDDSPEGHIMPGTIYLPDKTINTFVRGYYIGRVETLPENDVYTDDIIKAATWKALGGYAATTISNKGVTANTKAIFVACPTTNTGLTKVVMPSAFNADVTDLFIKQADPIPVTIGSVTHNYYLWVYKPAALTADSTFTFTLS